MTDVRLSNLLALVTSLVSPSSQRTSWRPSLRRCPAREPFGVSLAEERPRRLVIGHVLLRGHARNGAAGHQRLIGLTIGRDPRRLWPGGR
jgi:hypothetical protein